MKFFLFKIFLKLAIKLAPYKEVAHFLEQRLLCLKREEEMNACVRPRTHLKIKGNMRYTDFLEK